ncbi:hypothetical protein GKE82_02110 [Conexibacter sp. W3-3-2]|uniref:acyltransferase n=1 Tax=Conexibacter sp. W3-3-2 TaxID=2675227 RepID=UPI0012B8FCE2|nr:acyltransferase [Conexibacter sp. W3-3-2]MTD43130.1 hypothetical protein [Conexibacter sp. W3-3-2]
MVGRLLQLSRAARFRLWAVVTAARLRRLGGRLVLEVDEVPRLLGLPTVEIDGYPGTLTLRIGREVKLGSGLVIDLAHGKDGTIDLGDRVVFQNGVRLQPWGGAIRLGVAAQIRDRCELKSAGELILGERAICGRNVTLHCEERLELGAKVGLAERVTVIDSDHGFDGSDTFFMDQPVRSTPVLVGANSFVSTNGVVLRGSVIGENSVVAAGAVVNGGTYPPQSILGGIPARVLKSLADGAHAAT